MSKLEAFKTKYPFALSKPAPKYGFDWFGFECGEGWADLLEPVIAYIDTHNQFNPDNQIVIAQIKEKFGTLRFYVHTWEGEVDALIYEAENKSESTCETCGKNGKLRGKSWVYTACDEHTKEADKSKLDRAIDEIVNEEGWEE